MIDGGASSVGVRVIVCVDLLMKTVIFERLRCVQIETLHIQKPSPKAFFERLYHRAGDAAEREARVDVFLNHRLAQKSRNAQLCAAGTGLEREPVVEIAAVYDDV